MSQTAEALKQPEIQGHSLKKNSIGFIGVAFFVIASAAPMAAFVGAGPVLFAMMGPGVPLVYLIVGAIVAIFAVGYLKMSKHISNAGGFVAFIARGLGPRFATGAAGVVIVTYVALQVGFWSQYGVFAQQLLAEVGLNIPIWVAVIVTLVATTALTMRGIDFNLKVLGVLIALEVLVIVVFDITVGFSSSNSNLSLVSFSPTQLADPALGVAMIFVFACFTTFEATTVFAEETRNPRRDIPLALYTIILFVMVFYAVSTWVVSYAVGPETVQAVTANDLAGVFFALASQAAGPWLSDTMQVLVVTSFIAMLIGMQNMFARYCFALGRAGVLPRGVAQVSKTQAPARATLANGIVVAAIVMAFLWGGADPIVVIYSWFVAIGTTGFVCMMTLASIGILTFFIKENLETGVWSTKVAPTAAVILTAGALYITISNYGALLYSNNVVAKWMLLFLPIAFLLGFVLASCKKDIDFAIVAAS